MADPVSKKRKTTTTTSSSSSSPEPVPKPRQGRAYTLTIALPSTLLTTAPTPLLKTHLANTIARASAHHNIDEIVLYNPSPSPPPSTASTDPDQLTQTLSYLETPPYLRKRLFPLTPHLRHIGTLPPLILPTHPTATTAPPFRDAVALAITPTGAVSCDAGLSEPVLAITTGGGDSDIKPGTRLTLRMGSSGTTAEVVPPATPREETGTYVGYSVRRAGSLSAVFTESPWEGGYDVTVGAGAGDDIADGDKVSVDDAFGEFPAFRHLLVAVGGLREAAAQDPSLASVGARELFDFWVDAVPGGGGGVVRVEEALWGVLAGLRKVVSEKGVR